MDLHRFIAEYTEAVYHRKDPEAAARFIADPCIRHEHGHRVVMTLAENKARIAAFLASASAPRFRFVTATAEGEMYASAYECTFETDTGQTTLSGIEIFRVVDGKITETWNTAAGEGPWG
jgi:predicted SnoaL-like aldol condensation-catalyzing enzyme